MQKKNTASATMWRKSVGNCANAKGARIVEKSVENID
jgi:hypothetical protein